jgi:hypothetical protein
MLWRFLFVVVAVCSLSARASAEGETGIPLSPYVGQLKTIELTIDGHVARLLFDTGAGVTAVTPEFAASIGCSPSGVITSFRMDGERVTFQRCQSPSRIVEGHFSATQSMAVFDLHRVLPAGLPPLDGVAGLDLFRGRVITIEKNLAGIRLETRTSLQRIARTRAASRIRIAQEAGGVGLTIFAPMRIGAGDIWLLVDSANLAGVRLHPTAHLLLGNQQRVTLSIEGARDAVIEPEIVEGLIYDGALNAAFISQYAMTLDLAGARAWWDAR